LKEFWTNPVVQADAPRNAIDVGAHFLGKIRHLINERDLGGEKCISRI